MAKDPANFGIQLERLFAQNLSQMGYQARIRHQQRIEELQTRHAAGSPRPGVEADRDSAHVLTEQPAGA